MPANRVQSGLVAKYGKKIGDAVKTHANDEIDYGFQRLPAGITNGVAKLTKAYFAEYKNGTNKGEFYFRAEGVVVEPESVMVNGTPMAVQGLTTSIMEPVCTTTTQANKVTTQDEHIASVMNEMKKLGGQFQGGGAEELEAMAAALAEAGPYFRFSTSPRAPRPGSNDPPGVWENWYGIKGLENYEPPQAGGAVRDNTGGGRAASINGKHATAAEPEPADEYREDGDIDSLAERAAADDKEAQVQLKEHAVNAGWDADEVDNADSWDDVLNMVKNPKEGGGEEAEEPQEEQIKVGDVYKYRPAVKGPGGKETKAKKAVEAKVTAINAKAGTVDLKNLTDGKSIYKAVPVGELE